MMRALVVEDEWPTRNYLVELVEGSRIAHVVGAVSSVDEARQALASDMSIDVVFVDVNLGSGASGIDLTRSMSGKNTMFVFATAHEEHAVEAFGLGAVDYLLKPFTEERVTRCLQRVRDRLPASLQGPTRIVARKKKTLVFLEPSEIWAFEASERLTFVHTRDGKFDLDLSLVAIETSFGRAFLRVHRNWLVNITHVKALERGPEARIFVGVALETGIHVPVARERAQSVREMLLENTAGLRR